MELTSPIFASRFVLTFATSSPANLSLVDTNSNFFNLFPQGWVRVKRMDRNWKTYRTRFLVKAKQLTNPMLFVDRLGREHRGEKGDYLVESSEGMFSIQPRAIFEDIYVSMTRGDKNASQEKNRSSPGGFSTNNSIAEKPRPQPGIPSVNCLRYNM